MALRKRAKEASLMGEDTAKVQFQVGNFSVIIECEDREFVERNLRVVLDAFLRLQGIVNRPNR